MKHVPLGIAGAIITAAFVASGGCEPNSSLPTPSVSRTEAKVSGKVTADGAPVAKGKVTVSPPGPPFVERIAEIQPDGSYEIKTYIGKNSFSVTGTGSPAEGGAYNKKDFDVREGSNTIDLALPLADK